MNSSIRSLAAVMTAMIPAMTPIMAEADNLSGGKRVLCATMQVTRCYARGDCESGQHSPITHPRFLSPRTKDLRYRLVIAT